jgi:hypothetical protein
VAEDPKTTINTSTRFNPDVGTTPITNNSNAENMDVDEPPEPTQPAPPTPNTDQKIANTKQNSETSKNQPPHTEETMKDDNQPASRKTSSIKHQHTYRIFVKAFAYDQDEYNFTRLQAYTQY